MSKRKCPFEYDLTPQIKIHIGEKEIAQGSNQENMNSVYEKTLKTLMAGSKSFSCNKKNSMQNLESAHALDVCGCCRVIDSSQPSRCSYCDTIMCFRCLAQCAECSGTFCQNCSLILYDKGEQIICLSCYK